jgi:N-acetylneuraminic acid mutarotase
MHIFDSSLPVAAWTGYFKNKSMNHRYRTILLLFVSLLFFTPLLYAQNWVVTEVATLPEKVSNNAVCEGFIGGIPYLFSFGGIDSTKIYSGIHLRAYRYNISTGTTTALADLPDNMGKIASGASRVGDTIYIIGGYHVFSNGNEISSNKVHRYDVINNTYLSDGVSIPVPIDDHVQAVWHDSLIYVITGWSNNTNVPNVQIYNPSSDSWSTGAPMPNNNSYKSFGASGYIVQDTIYYFGGAALGSSFPAQNSLRKGIIDPNNPANITWSFVVPNPLIKGYRMACTTVGNNLHWIGGSEITYNYNGIAYNGTGGVPPLNRDLYIDASLTNNWTENFTNTFPMDLRGIANVNDSVKYLAGGMLTNQVVTDKIYRLVWTGNTTGITEAENTSDNFFSFYPNPVAGEKITINFNKQLSASAIFEIYDATGSVIIRKHATGDEAVVSVKKLKKGIYYIRVYDGAYFDVKKVVIF